MFVPLLADDSHLRGGGAASPYAVEDPFTAADGTALPGRTPPVNAGHAWATLTGTGANQTVQSNRANFACNNTREDVYVDSGLADATVSADLAIGAEVGSTAILTFRVQDTDNYWQVVFDSGSTTLYKIVGGAVAGSTTISATHTPGVAYTATATFAGSSISVQVGAEAAITATDGTFSDQTSHGCGGYCPTAGTVTADTFRVAA